MAHAANKEKYSSINRIAMAERAFLEEVDRRSPDSAIFTVFLSREDDETLSETLFRSVLLHPILSNVNRFTEATK